MNVADFKTSLEEAKQKINTAIEKLNSTEPPPWEPTTVSLPTQIIEETEKRFLERMSVREENRKKLESGSWLEINDPRRVQRRLRRLGQTGTPSDKPADARFFESIFGRNNLLSINFFDRGLLAAKTVGRVVVRYPGSRWDYGTGFMVSPRLLLTNNHVIPNANAASKTTVEFNYQEGPQGEWLHPVSFRLEPETFFVTDVKLDYSLGAVSERGLDGDVLKSFGWNRLIEEQGKLLLGEFVNIIQHPSGQIKQLAIRDNQVIDILDDFLHYQTDTTPGSSGAPVFNDQWELVCLHHSGVPKRDSQGRILTTSGTLWTEDLGEQWIDWEGNEGVRISRILQHIKQLNLSTDVQRQVRDEIF